MTEPRVLAKVDDYPGLLMAFRARANERKFTLSGDDNHHVAGLSDRRITQMLSLQTLRTLANVRRVGINSLGPLLGFLGAEIWLVESKWAMDKFDGRLTKRNERKVRDSGAIHFVLTKKKMREIGAKGLKVRWDKVRKKRTAARKAGKASGKARRLRADGAGSITEKMERPCPTNCGS